MCVTQMLETKRWVGYTTGWADVHLTPAFSFVRRELVLGENEGAVPNRRLNQSLERSRLTRLAVLHPLARCRWNDFSILQSLFRVCTFFFSFGAMSKRPVAKRSGSEGSSSKLRAAGVVDPWKVPLSQVDHQLRSRLSPHTDETWWEFD